MEMLPITLVGFTRLKEELNYLKSSRLPSIIKLIAELEQDGADPDDPEYQSSLTMRAQIDARMNVLADRIQCSEVVDVAKISGSVVQFGATVVLQPEEGDHLTYQIVASDESDIKSGLLSVNGALARALLGKEEGDTVEVLESGGYKGYEIIRVKFV